MERRQCWESVSTTDNKPVERTRWEQKGAWGSRHYFEKEMGYWTADLERAEWVNRKVSSSAWRWLRPKAIH